MHSELLVVLKATVLSLLQDFPRLRKYYDDFKKVTALPVSMRAGCIFEAVRDASRCTHCHMDRDRSSGSASLFFSFPQTQRRPIRGERNREGRRDWGHLLPDLRRAWTWGAVTQSLGLFRVPSY